LEISQDENDKRENPHNHNADSKFFSGVRNEDGGEKHYST
jgi:hypothetical protein